jgi:hypothetical protein
VLFLTHQIDEAVYLSDRVVVLSARPGRVNADVDVTLPRPRSLSLKRTETFLAVERRVWDLIDAGGSGLVTAWAVLALPPGVPRRPALRTGRGVSIVAQTDAVTWWSDDTARNASRMCAVPVGHRDRWFELQ